MLRHFAIGNVQLSRSLRQMYSVDDNADDDQSKCQEVQKMKLQHTHTQHASNLSAASVIIIIIICIF